jgi:hypothetical protein
MPSCVALEGGYNAALKRDFKLSWREAEFLIISMIKGIRTRRLSIQNSLSLFLPAASIYALSEIVQNE